MRKREEIEAERVRKSVCEREREREESAIDGVIQMEAGCVPKVCADQCDQKNSQYRQILFKSSQKCHNICIKAQF